MNEIFKNKIKLNNVPWRNRIDLKNIIKIIGKKNIKLVGGVVRDAVKGDKIKDIDLTTSIVPSKIKNLFSDKDYKIIDFAEDHGVLLVVSKKYEYQVTTLRQDINSDGRYAKVKFTTNFLEDSNRRDFTINALYSDFEGNVYDPQGGLLDLDQAKIRFIGDPSVRIKEDYLRILRYFRFLSYYTHDLKQIDQPSMRACIDNAENIKKISRERISNEFLKLIEGKNCVLSLNIMKENNILNLISNDLNNVSKESLMKLETLPKNKNIRLAFLIIGSKIDYLKVSADLKLSNKVKKLLKILISNQSLVFTKKNIGRHLYFFGRFNVKYIYIINSVFSGKKLNESIIKIIDLWKSPIFPLTGSDVIQYGIKEGKRVGDILNAVKIWWIEKNFKNNREDCLKKMKKILIIKN